MKTFLNTNLSLKQRITLYRCLYTLNEMSFSYLRPVVFGTIAVCLIFIWHSLPESYILARSESEVALYRTFLTFSLLCFLIFVRPYMRRLIGKTRVYLYRRKKRATRSLFRFN